MKDLFDKDFFKFTIGFLLIIVSSFTLMALSGYYDTSTNASVAADQELAK